jgi:hypothetical protein
MEIACLLEKYQTIVVGLVGFTGVIVTLYANSRLDRKQHEREILHEERALRQALISELRILRGILEDRSQAKLEGPYSDCMFPALIPDTVYQTFLPRIGILSKEEVSAVMGAYVLVAELPQRLWLLCPAANVERGTQEYIFIDKRHLATAVGIHKVLLREVSKALNVLEQHEVTSL